MASRLLPPIQNPPTNFVKKIKISNEMFKDACIQSNILLRRTNAISNNQYATSLNVFNPAQESDYDQIYKPTSNLIDSNTLPFSSVPQHAKSSNFKFSSRNPSNTQVFWGGQTFDIAHPDFEPSGSNSERKRPKAKYSLFKRNDE